MGHAHRQTQRQPVKRLTPDPVLGLTARQAEERAQAGWDNRDPNQLTKTTGQILRDNLVTFFNLLFLAFALVLFAVGQYRDMLFLGIVVVNVLIGIVQELRVKHALDRVSLLSAPTATVVRDGRTRTIPAQELVLDDIVLLAAGDQVCADAILCQGGAEVNEALLTGEADPVPKGVGDQLLSGSFLSSGRCAARLDRVGADAYATALAGEAKGRRTRRSGMMRSLDRLLRLIGVAIVPLGTVMFFKQAAILSSGLPYAVSSTVAAMVGMIPEGLYLLVSTALAVSMIQLARKRALVHEMSCIENLARVDVLCLDKTGTLTHGELEVLELRPVNCSMEELSAWLGRYVDASSGGNATAAALKQRFGGQPESWTPVREVFFSSQRKWSALCLPNGTDYLLGAPEVLLGKDWSLFEPDLRDALGAGQRVLLLAEGAGALEGDRLAGPLVPLGFAILSDKLRPDAATTLAYFKEQGVTVKVISGDNAQAAAQVSRRAGVDRADRWVDLSALPEGETDWGRMAEQHTVFGRVTPGQKRALIQGLQARGHTVAMLGDGVNDVLALKDADCSVAMAAGSEAAQHVSQMVLLDSNFDALPHIVREGRRVINNIERSASLFLVKNIFSFLVSLVLLFLPAVYPLVPAQISLISALFIGAPSFLLTFEPYFGRIQGHFLRNILLNALPGGLTNVVTIFTMLAVGQALALPLEQVSTLCALLVGVNGFLVLLFLCWPLTGFRGLVLALMAAGFAGAVVFLSPLFQLATLTTQSWQLFALMAAAAPALMAVFTFLVSRVKVRLRVSDPAPRRARAFS